MIQRIQSIFLFLAGVCSLLLLALPFAATEAPVAQSAMFSDAEYSVQDNTGVMVLFILGGALSLLAILLYRNRGGQIRVGILAFIANLIGLVLALVYFMQNNQLGSTDVTEQLGIGMPFLAFVFLLLAIRFIRKDDNLVRSADRLR